MDTEDITRVEDIDLALKQMEWPIMQEAREALHEAMAHIQDQGGTIGAHVIIHMLHDYMAQRWYELHK